MRLKRLLIIFVKNLQYGKVKTRLASDVGNDKALEIYRQLIAITERAASQINAEKEVWYSDYVAVEDVFDEEAFRKKVQNGENLGARMANAIREAFENGYEQVVIIGSDCPDISEALFETAFRNLEKHNAVIGPSKDGGYYLLGLNVYSDMLFNNISWSTGSVLDETVEKLESAGLSYVKMPELNDIDTLEDLKKSKLWYGT